MNTREDIAVDSSNRVARMVSVIGVLAIAGFGLLGYVPGWRTLGSLRSDFIPMAPSTAISFIFLATILLLGRRAWLGRNRYLSLSVVSIVSLFGFLKFVEYPLGVDRSFEELIIGTTPKLGEIPIGIMSSSTGAIFVLAGVTMLLFYFQQLKKWNNTILMSLPGGFGCAVLVGALVYTLGYLYGSPLLYGSGRVVPMAITTAVAFLLLGTALLNANSTNHFPLAMLSGASVRARMMRAFVPVIIISVIGHDIVSRLWPLIQADPIIDAAFAIALVIATIIIVFRLERILSKKMDEAESQRKMAEEALRESQQKLSSHLQNTPVAAIEWNLDFEVVEWNAAAERVFGYTKEEALGRHAAGLIVPVAGREHIDKVWNDLLKNQGGFHSTNENLTKDGRTIVCDWNNTPLVDDSGKVYGVASLVQDITDRLRAEAEREQSREFLQTVVDGIPDPMVVINLDYSIAMANLATRKKLGGKDPVGLSMKCHQVFHHSAKPCEGAEDPCPLREVVATKAPVTMEHTHYDSEDQATVVEITAAPIFDEHGEVVQIIETCQDISERKKAEEALRESEEKYRSIAERTYDVIMSVQLDGQIAYVSPSVRRVFGYAPEELVGKNTAEFVSESELQHTIETFQLSATGQNVEGHHSEFRKKDGSYASIELNAVPIYKNDTIIGAQAVIRDITETKRLQSLESRAARLETAGTIAGQVAHDFNNLLAPIMAYPEFVREELAHDSKAHSFLDDMEKAAEKIADINQDLLTMGRRGHYNQEVLDLNRVVLQATREMDARTETMTVETNLAKDLLMIKGGAAQIHRMLTNLLVNAQDAMGDIGRITVRTENYYADDTLVAFGRVPKGEYVKLTISDTGCGIPEDTIEKILDPFFTTKTADKKRGSGLGLSVVDAVTKDHNGYLDLCSKVGEGTSFYIYFPITRETVDSQDADEVFGGNETVLVVDDDSIQREVSSRLLAKAGYEVSSVNSGEHAVEFVRDNAQDILILDMVMPCGIDGAETYRRILEINPNQKAIILSGFSESEQILAAQRLGAGAFVRKPITRNTIAAAVRVELDRPVAVAASDPVS